MPEEPETEELEAEEPGLRGAGAPVDVAAIFGRGSEKWFESLPEDSGWRKFAAKWGPPLPSPPPPPPEPPEQGWEEAASVAAGSPRFLWNPYVPRGT